jgi:site-specific recombinase XerD
MAGCDPLTDQQIRRMEAGCTGTYKLRDRCFMVMADTTGYRVSELLSLTIADVWDGTRIKDSVHVKAKHMKKQVPRDPVPLHPDCKHAIMVWLTALQQALGTLRPTCPLFRSRKSKAGDRACSREHMWYVIKKTAVAVGVHIRVGCHSFRKSLAIRIYRAFKKDLLLVQQVLGHKQVSSTEVYLRGALKAAEVKRAFLLPRRTRFRVA